MHCFPEEYRQICYELSQRVHANQSIRQVEWVAVIFRPMYFTTNFRIEYNLRPLCLRVGYFELFVILRSQWVTLRPCQPQDNLFSIVRSFILAVVINRMRLFK